MIISKTTTLRTVEDGRRRRLSDNLHTVSHEDYPMRQSKTGQKHS